MCWQLRINSWMVLIRPLYLTKTYCWCDRMWKMVAQLPCKPGGQKWGRRWDSRVPVLQYLGRYVCMYVCMYIHTVLNLEDWN
jgi:hypothetical protein